MCSAGYARGAFAGVGAFNLVRADAYRDIGGHAALRFEVIDDLKLGLLVARAGHRLRAYGAAHDLEVHWADSVRGMIRKVAYLLRIEGQESK